MDNHEIKLIAHLKVLLRKEGFNLDVQQFVADRTYARAAIDMALKSDNEEVLTTALELAEKEHLLKHAEPPAKPAETTKPEPPEDDSGKPKYVGRLR